MKNGIVLRSVAETEAFAAGLAGKVRPGDVLFLEGTLGAGKSVFARALIRTLCGDAALDVPSPTFTLVQTYDSPAGPIWHFDLYRLETPEDVYELGWEEALAEGIAVVEWPSRIRVESGAGLAPKDRLEIGFQPSGTDAGTRIATLSPHGQWKDRL